MMLAGGSSFHFVPQKHNRKDLGSSSSSSCGKSSGESNNVMLDVEDGSQPSITLVRAHSVELEGDNPVE